MIKKIKGVLVSAAVACLVLATTVTAQAAVNRSFAGSDRYDTANKIVQSGWTSADAVILASGSDSNLVDSLTVAPLAKKLNAPIILVQPGDKDNLSKALSEIKTLGATKVYIATGSGVLSDSFLGIASGKLGDATVTRLGGPTRFETALNIAKEVSGGQSVDAVAVASGDDAHLVDALSIAPIAAIKGMPILLSQSNGLASSVKDFAAGAKKAYVLGGSTVISDSVASALPSATRLFGAGRYQTNTAILSAFKDDASIKYSNLYVASGEDSNLVDALAGSPLAAKNSAPILLAHDTVESGVVSLLKSKLTTDSKIDIFGGTAAVTENVVTSLTDILANLVNPVAYTGLITDVQSATFGSKVTVSLVNSSVAPTAVNYQVLVSGKAVSSSAKLGTATTVFPAMKKGDVVSVALIDASGAVIKTITGVQLGMNNPNPNTTGGQDSTAQDVYAVWGSATFGSKVAVTLGNTSAAPSAVKYQVFVNGKAVSSQAALGSTTTVFPAMKLGDKVTVEFFDASGAMVLTKDTTLVDKVGPITSGTATTPVTAVTGAASDLKVTRADATFGSKVTVALSDAGVKDIASAAKYQISVSGKAASSIVALGTTTTVFPAVKTGDTISVTLYAADGTTVVSTISGVTLN